MVIASVHLVDGSALASLTRRTPRVPSTPGLRWARKAWCARFSPGIRPSPQPGRSGFVAWWDDDAALDAFLTTHPLAPAYRGGWGVRLRPVRMRAQWPGAEFDPLPSGPERHDGVHAAITLGAAHLRSLLGFIRTSSAIEDQFVDDPGGRWGVAISMFPRIVMTLTFWDDQDATDAFVGRGAHAEAMRNNYDFATDTHQYVAPGGFFGFQPYAMTGNLTGPNPTPSDLLS